MPELELTTVFLLHALEVTHGGEIDGAAHAPSQQVDEQWNGSE
jgi:hypothetical protein